MNSLEDTDIRDALDVQKSIEQKKATGSPSSLSIRSSIEGSRKRLEQDRQNMDHRATVLKEAIDTLIRDARRIAREQ